MGQQHAWAVITGGSSGIGAAIAAHLAAHGFNVALVGRDAQALETQAALLRPRGVEVAVIPADLATPDGVERVIADLHARCQPLEILVNNAGFGLHGLLLETDAAIEEQMIAVQVNATLALTRAVLPGMVQRRSGRILNVASVYAFTPVPRQAVYAACKSFMVSLSQSLAVELMGTGVTVSAVCPGITQTAFRSRAGLRDKRSAFAMSADAVADAAVRGLFKGRATIVPGWHNAVFALLTRLLPGTFPARLTRWINQRRGLTHGDPPPAGG